MSSWLAANPDQTSDRSRLDQLGVTNVLQSSDLADGDMSDEGLARAALLFPRREQVSLFRFFCQVRAWSSTQHVAPPPTFRTADAPLERETVIDLRDSTMQAQVTSPVTTVPVTTVAMTTVPAPTAPAMPDVVARTAEPVPVRAHPPVTTATKLARPTTSSHRQLRCPHSAAALAAMPSSRAAVASFEFDVLVDTTWAQALSVVRDASRIVGDPEWGIEEHFGADLATLHYRSTPTATPHLKVTVAYRAGADGNMISFRVAEVRTTTLQSLFGRRDTSRPARVLARRLAWGLLPEGSL